MYYSILYADGSANVVFRLSYLAQVVHKSQGVLSQTVWTRDGVNNDLTPFRQLPAV
jgi:hypothetical protein